MSFTKIFSVIKMSQAAGENSCALPDNLIPWQAFGQHHGVNRGIGTQNFRGVAVEARTPLPTSGGWVSRWVRARRVPGGKLRRSHRLRIGSGGSRLKFIIGPAKGRSMANPATQNAGRERHWNSAAAMTEEEVTELKTQLERLRQEHRDLDAAIEALQAVPGADLLQVQRLKKRKLILRDRISFIEDQLTPDIIA
jgi:hypothetical protein